MTIYILLRIKSDHVKNITVLKIIGLTSIKYNNILNSQKRNQIVGQLLASP